MNTRLQITLLVMFISYNLAECRHRHIRQAANDCLTFRQICSELCFKNVENDQCWGSPRYTQCICNDRTIHQLPDYPCEHPECPKDVVKEGTTRKPINRKPNQEPIRKGLGRNPITDVEVKKQATKPIISDDCQTFRQICSGLCFTNVENDQCWGSPRYTQCICNDRTVHQIPEYPCEHPECPKDVVKEGTTRKPINRVRQPIRNRTRGKTN